MYKCSMCGSFVQVGLQCSSCRCAQQSRAELARRALGDGLALSMSSLLGLCLTALFVAGMIAALVRR